LHLPLLFRYIFIFDTRETFFGLECVSFAILAPLLCLYCFLELSALSHLERILFFNNFHGMIKIYSKLLFKDTHYLNEGKSNNYYC